MVVGRRRRDPPRRRRHACLVLADVREHRYAVDVAARPDALAPREGARRPRSPAPTTRSSRFSKPKPLTFGAPPVATSSRSASSTGPSSSTTRNPCSILRSLSRRRAEAPLPPRFEPLWSSAPASGSSRGKSRSATVGENVTSRAQPAEQLRELAADRPRAEDDDALRHLAGGGGLAVRPVLGLRKAGHRRDRTEPSRSRSRASSYSSSRSSTSMQPGAATTPSPRTTSISRSARNVSWPESSQPFVTCRDARTPGRRRARRSRPRPRRAPLGPRPAPRPGRSRPSTACTRSTSTRRRAERARRA